MYERGIERRAEVSAKASFHRIGIRTLSSAFALSGVLVPTGLSSLATAPLGEAEDRYGSFAW